MLRRLIFIASLSLSTWAVAADVVVQGFYFTLPEGYEPSTEGRNRQQAMFIRKGDGKEQLAKLNPKREYSSRFLADYFHNGTVAFLAISVMDVPKSKAGLSADDLLREIGRSFEHQWGTYSFSWPQEGRGIWWFVNYAGAFVAVASRVVDGKVVMVESMDMAHVLVDDAPNPTEKSAETLWTFYRKAANATDAEQLLLSARPASGAPSPEAKDR